MKKLYRTEGRDAVVFGVCGGIGEYLNVDPNIVRLVAALLIIAGGVSLWIYIIAALILPKKSTIYPGF